MNLPEEGATFSRLSPHDNCPDDEVVFFHTSWEEGTTVVRLCRTPPSPPRSHAQGPAVTREMFPTSPTLLLFVPRCSLVKRDNSVICILFHPPLHHGPLSRCKIYIFTHTKVNWFGNGFGEAICLQVSAKSLASVKVHSITPFSSPDSSVSQHRSCSSSAEIRLVQLSYFIC